jgi:hypothetical protein
VTRQEKFEDQASREGAAAAVKRYQAQYLTALRAKNRAMDQALAATAGDQDFGAAMEAIDVCANYRWAYQAAIDVLQQVYPDLAAGFSDPYLLDTTADQADPALIAR